MTPIERRLAVILARLMLPFQARFRKSQYQLDFALALSLVCIDIASDLYHSSEATAVRRDRNDAWLTAWRYRVQHLIGVVIMNDTQLWERLIKQTVPTAALRLPCSPKRDTISRV